MKKEIEKQLCQTEQQISGNIKTAVSDNCNRSWTAPVTSIRCSIIADAQAEENFLTTLDQFEKEMGIP